MNGDENRGEEILDLLNNLRPDPLIEEVQFLYAAAFNNRKELETATKRCADALFILNNQEAGTLYNAKALADAKGRFHLLLASTYLNREAELGEAEAGFKKSISAYHSMQLERFESLAHLGLAITLRKMDMLKMASDECENAYTIARDIRHKDVPQAVGNLLEAIEQERARIQRLISPEDQLSTELFPPSRARATMPGDEVERKFKVCDIVKGREIIEEERGATKLNLFGMEQYEKYFREVSLPLRRLGKEAQNADYVLLLEGVDQTRGAADDRGTKLDRQHLLFIKQVMRPGQLSRKQVAVLVMSRTILGIRTYATLKVFMHCEDHCLLKRRHVEEPSIIVVAYGTDSKLDKYYLEYKPLIRKFAYDVAVSGVVVDTVPRSNLL